MSWYSGWRDAFDAGDIGDELASLRKQVASLQRKLERRGRAGISSAEDRATEFYEELRDRIIDALPMFQRQAQVAGDFARSNRGAIVATVAVVGLLVALAATRRPQNDQD